MKAKHLFSLFLVVFTILCSTNVASAQELTTIKLPQHSIKKGDDIMTTLQNRKSVREFSDKKLTDQEISDILWAANGINRSDGKRTAPSAKDQRDIKSYVCMEKGNYYYDPKANELQPISTGDVRPWDAPIVVVLVSEGNNKYSGTDAGIVSENISLFCASTGLATVCRAQMDLKILTKALKLTPNQTLQLNHPVGYSNE
jgi:nitroreductase